MVPRYLRGYGLIEAPLPECVARLAGGAVSGPSTLATPRASSRRQAIEYLDHLTHPSTRWALFAVNGRWSAIVSNQRDGSDFADEMFFVADLIGSRVCRVVDQDEERRSVGPYKVRLAYPARIFELVEPSGGSFSDTARSIHAVLDGDRWSFSALGDSPLPIEATFNYEARLKRDRFTSKNLRDLLASLGVKPSVPIAFESAESIWLIDRRLDAAAWHAEVEANACTPEQADDPGYGYLERGLGWVPHMRTHADSVVWDLTRAVLLSPQLRDDAQQHLDAARRRLGNDTFAKLAVEAEENLIKHGG